MNIRKQGVASSFLSTRKVKDIVSLKIQQSTFRLPDNPETPIIMIGAGTGISPFIGFTEERSSQKSNGPIGESFLFYGCCSRNAMVGVDLWEKEIQNGVLNNVITAFSQETTTKVYVQDQIASNFNMLWPFIEKGATIYSCGDVKVGIAVKDTLIECIAKNKNCSISEATRYIQEMQQNHKYQRSEWGLQDTPSKTIARARFRIWVKSVVVILRFSRIAKGK